MPKSIDTKIRKDYTSSMEGNLNLETLLKSAGIDFFSFPDEETKKGFILLFNIIEEANGTIRELREENQNLKDEINRLKGEQGKPKINGSTKGDGDISSEKERRSRAPKPKNKKTPKISDLPIDETNICKVDREKLPDDAEFKGYQDVIIQDIIIQRHVTKFKKEVFYSKVEKKNFTGHLPPGYHGKFGPQIRSLVITLHYATKVSERNIAELLKNFGIQISPGTVSNILIEDNSENQIFIEEKETIYQTGLETGGYHQIDDTCARVNGENKYVQIVCNRSFSAFFTTNKKDRLTIIDVLRNFRDRIFILNEESLCLLNTFKISDRVIQWLEQNITWGKKYSTEEIDPILANIKGKNQRTRIYEALYIAAYHIEIDFPIVETLVSDDAKQFKHLTQHHMLCWIHDGRLYKKLTPCVPFYQKILEDFLTIYWDYYHDLLEYTQNPDEKKARDLEIGFELIFTTKTDYDKLDKRIKLTYDKKIELLLPLQYPEIPLHNNESELSARHIKRSLDVSLHTMTKRGTDVRDTFMTIIVTAKKLGVNVIEYIRDRVGGIFKLPSLASLIKAKNALS